MTQMKHWPSRRFQIVAIACILVFLLLATLAPLAIPARRAMRLYREAWFGILCGPGKEADSLARFKAALRIEPNNDLYQQALVWRSRREDLPELLRTSHLGRKASALAIGLMTGPDSASQTPEDVLVQGFRARLGTGLETERAPTYAQIETALRARLADLSHLRAADPGNALPMYRKAYALANAGRIDDAVDAVREGNRLPFRFYIAEVTPEALNSLITPVAGGCPGECAMVRQLVRILSESADQRLRGGDVNGARTILRACCGMGVNVSGAKPESFIGYMLGRAVFVVAWSKLGPIEKDFPDTSGGAERGKRTMQAFDADLGRMRTHADGMVTPVLRQVALLSATPLAATGAAVLLALTMIFGWVPSAIQRRRRGESPITVAAWPEGFLFRLGICAMALAIVCLVAMVSIENAEGLPSSIMLIALVIAPALLVFLVSVFRLRRVYSEQTGERVGALRFIFGRFDSVGAWSRKYVSAALASYLLLLACVAALICGFTTLRYDSPPVSFAILVRSTLHSEQSITRQAYATVAGEWRR